MKVYSFNTHESILQLACKATQKWGVAVSGFNPDYDVSYDEYEQAALWLDLNDDTHKQAFWDGFAIILCDTEEEMIKIYKQTVGDDGATELNPYNGSVRLYAKTCDPNGDLMSENT